MTMKKIGVLPVVLALSVGLALAQQAVNERRPLAPAGQVSIENIAGKVTVAGWSRDEVEITGTLGKGTEGLEITGDANRLSIEVKYPKEGRHNDIDESVLTLHVPQGCRLDVQTVSARIDLSEFDGEAELQSVSGDVHVEGSPKSLDLSTVSGPIYLVSKEPLSGGEFKTVSGDMDVNADLGATGRFKLVSVSGDILLTVPKSISAEFEASSFSGKIENDFGVQPKKSNPYLNSVELTFTLGGGGARVSVQTLSGDIRLKKS